MFWSPPTLCTLLGKFAYIPCLPPFLTLTFPLQRHCESQGCSITDAIRGQRTALGGLNQLILFSLISAFYNPHKDTLHWRDPKHFTIGFPVTRLPHGNWNSKKLARVTQSSV